MLALTLSLGGLKIAVQEHFGIQELQKQFLAIEKEENGHGEEFTWDAFVALHPQTCSHIQMLEWVTTLKKVNANKRKKEVGWYAGPGDLTPHPIVMEALKNIRAEKKKREQRTLEHGQDDNFVKRGLDTSMEYENQVNLYIYIFVFHFGIFLLILKLKILKFCCLVLGGGGFSLHSCRVCSRRSFEEGIIQSQVEGDWGHYGSFVQARRPTYR